MSNRPYLIALNHIPGIGPRGVIKLLRRWPDLKDMFSLSASQLQAAGLSSVLATAIASFNFRKVDNDLVWATEDRHHLLTWDDTLYPALLREISDPPLTLYAIGDLNCLYHTNVAIVGSRNPSLTGKDLARTFGYELATHGVVVVSGLALGIDERAHTGAIEASGKTIAVMGTGVDHIYPYRHRPLAESIIKNGLLLSEFPRGTQPIAGHFPRRNRIISGLSLCTLVVEASLRSGSLITARLALEQNREVLAVPGSLQNPQAKGCHHLLQQGAKLVVSTQDILDELPSFDCSMSTGKFDKFVKDNCNDFMKYIGCDITHIDNIVEQSGLSLNEVLCQLAQLEIEGLISAVAGGYTRCS